MRISQTDYDARLSSAPHPVGVNISALKPR